MKQKRARLLLTAGESGRRFDPPMTSAGVMVNVRAGRLRVAAITEGRMRLFEPDEVDRLAAARRAKKDSTAALT